MRWESSFDSSVKGLRAVLVKWTDKGLPDSALVRVALGYDEGGSSVVSAEWRTE